MVRLATWLELLRMVRLATGLELLQDGQVSHRAGASAGWSG